VMKMMTMTMMPMVVRRTSTNKSCGDSCDDDVMHG
jgi:hypothetical protein